MCRYSRRDAYRVWGVRAGHVCICVKICMPSYSYVCVLQLDVSHTCICVPYLYMCRILVWVAYLYMRKICMIHTGAMIVVWKCKDGMVLSGLSMQLALFFWS